MHVSIQNLLHIQSEIKEKIINKNFTNYRPEIIAVSKTFKIDHIIHLVNHGHLHFGENKVQEAIEKWNVIKSEHCKLKLHMIGKLQTNKVKNAIKIFDYIHSVDSMKLAKKISDEQEKIGKKLKIFIQVNLENEPQKSGVSPDNLENLINYCREINLDLVGLMCLPPFDGNSHKYFEKLSNLNNKFFFKEISMGMSHDFIDAINFKSTFLRIGSKIFGNRS